MAKNRLTTFLYVIEAVGAVFTAFFLVAYLGGLPTTAVLHSEAVFKIPLLVLGAALIMLIIGAAITAAIAKHG